MSLELNIPDVVQPGFAFHAAPGPAGLHVRLTGSADARATSELDAFVRRVHDEARRLAAAEVVVDLCECRFMNSSCFKAFLGWLAAIGDLPADAQYRVRFTWDDTSYWQRRGLQALKAYAADVVQI